MELRKTEEQVASLTAEYRSLCRSNNAAALTSNKNLPDLPELPKRPDGSTELIDNNATSKDDDDDSPATNNRRATEVMASLEYLQRQQNDLQDTMDKFQKRLNDKDPVTGAPRYGAKTAKRVGEMLQSYQDLCVALDVVFGRGQETENERMNSASFSVVDSIRQEAEREIVQDKRRKEQELLRLQQEEQARQAQAEQARREAEEAAAELARREQEAADEIARLAEAARRETERAQRAAAEADAQWINSIPNRKTLQGVSQQLEIFFESSSSTSSSSMTALHTLFAQIVAHPEEANFRRIRRDHERFQNDIGQYSGGKELLIAAGFELGMVDEVPSFVCKEPNIETDMDGWAAWFDLLKGTLELIEQVMIKSK